MFQQLHLILDWLASPQGSNCLRAIFALAAALGLNGRIVAGLLALFHLWLAFH